MCDVVRDGLGSFGGVRGRSGPFGVVRGRLGLFGAVRGRSGSFRVVRGRSGWFGAVRGGYGAVRGPSACGFGEENKIGHRIFISKKENGEI